MIHSVLQKLPLGENAKVALGVLFVCGVGTLPMLSKRGKGYDSMADKLAEDKAQEHSHSTPSRVLIKMTIDPVWITSLSLSQQGRHPPSLLPAPLLS